MASEDLREQRPANDEVVDDTQPTEAPQRFDTLRQARAQLRRLADEADDPERAETLRQGSDASMILGSSGQLAIIQVKRGSWMPTILSSGLAATYYPAPSRQEAVEYLARFEALRDADGNPFPWHNAQEVLHTWRSYRGASYAEEMQDIDREQDVAHGRHATRAALDVMLAERAATAERRRLAQEKIAAEDAWLAEQKQAAEAQNDVQSKPYADVKVGDEVTAYRRISVRRGFNNASKMNPIGRNQPIMHHSVPAELTTGDVLEIRGTVLATYPAQVNLHDATYRTPDGRSGSLRYATLNDLDRDEHLLVRAARADRPAAVRRTMKPRAGASPTSHAPAREAR